MSSAPIKTYDLDRVILVVGGLPVNGFGETDAVSIEPVEQRTVVSYTADGQATASRSGVRGYRATITVSETSLGYKTLAGLQAVQRAQNPIVQMPFALEDLNNGDSVIDQYAVFTDAPTISKGKTVGERVFVIELTAPVVLEGALISA